MMCQLNPRDLSSWDDGRVVSCLDVQVDIKEMPNIKCPYSNPLGYGVDIPLFTVYPLQTSNVKDATLEAPSVCLAIETHAAYASVPSLVVTQSRRQRSGDLYWLTHGRTDYHRAL